MKIKSWLTALVLVAFATPIAAQSVPTQQRGLSADTAYQIGELDHINLFNGNLSLTLPIGNLYPLGPGFGYSLTLSYNSKVWDYEDTEHCLDSNQKQYSYVLPKPVDSSNAGLGWSLNLGSFNGAKYTAPDGSDHFFLPELHPGYPASPGDVYYTQNSSYLRLRTLTSGCGGGGGCKVVEFPDGSAREFKAFDTNDWRLTRLRDAFGHYLDIAYSTNKWTLTDEHGRSHEINFTTLSNMETVVDNVVLKTFGGAASVWDFSYVEASLPRQDYLPPPCIPTPPSRFIDVNLLDKVTLPGGSYYQMTYSPTDALDQMSGGVTSMRLPTGGKFAWDYVRYYFTSIELPPNSEASPWTSSIGVKTRKIYISASDSEPHGTWAYSQEEGAFGQAPGDLNTTPCFSKTTVHDPEDNESVHYFATQKAVHQWAYGLPFTFCDPSNNNTYQAAGPWVSQQLFEGTAAEGTHVRTSRVEYEGDGPLGHGYQDKNLRLIKSRTIYHDDGDRWQETAFSDFDGLGNYRTTTQTGNFWTTNPTRTSTTQFNRDNGTLVIDRDTSSTAGSTFVLPAESAIWRLDTYDVSTVSQSGTTWRTDSCFDERGFLLWQRSLAGSSPQANDVLMVYEEDGTSGRIAREKAHGGDGANLSTGYSTSNVCAMSLPSTAPIAETRQIYDAGVVTEKWAVAGGNSSTTGDDVDILSLINQDIDSSTGLPSALYDVADVKTDLLYDALGRLTGEQPADDAWSSYSYSLPTATEGPKLTMARCANGATSCSSSQALSYASSDYDGLGRRVRETVYFPASFGTTSESRVFTWNALGWKLAQSTWGDEDLESTWSGFDRFGRPAEMHLPGKNPISLFQYLGARVVKRQERIVTGFGGAQTWDHKAELLDHLGRLIEVCEGMNVWWNGSCSGEVTQYSYSPRDQLTKVCSHAAGSSCGQERIFAFDGRGFLTGEKHPEIGTNGNDWTTFTYDGAGRVKTRAIAGSTDFNLAYRYDAADRLLELRQQSPNRPLKEFFYARTNDGDNLRRGKLVRALRHNWVSPTSPLFTEPEGLLDFIVSDHFEYRGSGGRLSQKVTTQRFGSGTRAFSSNYAWNELGQPETIDYPVCLEWPCEDRAPARTLGLGYTKGLLTSVGDFASLSYQLGGSMVHEISHVNGVTWTQTINTGDRQARPSSIATTGVALGANWSTGTYDYDGAWNIHQIGNTEFRYDRFHRLVEGQVDVGTIKSQKAAYDSYGNLTSLDTAGAIQTLSPNGSTNRLSGVTYDVAGNTRQITLAGTTYQYGFEAAGQLEFLKSNANQAKVFTYDAADERLLTWDCPLSSCGPNSALERWTLRGLGGEVLRVFEGKSSAELAMKEDFIYRGGQTLAAVRPTAAGGEETFAIHLDHLGSTRQVTSEAGTEVERHDFYPFGEEATIAQAGDIPLKFTGHERDRNGGGKGMLDYMHARSCSPITGRFLSVDPFGAIPQIPQSWNRYSYVFNQPSVLRDPRGLFPAGPIGQYFRDVCYQKGLCSDVIVTVTAKRVSPHRDLYVLFGYATFGKDGRGGSGPSPPANVFDLHQVLAEVRKTQPGILEFINKSKTGGAWDSKKFCEKVEGDPCQHFGNYAWGMLAAANGFALITTLRGAGFYQAIGGKSKIEWIQPVSVLPLLSEPPYGDDPEDQYWISRGWTDYQALENKP